MLRKKSLAFEQFCVLLENMADPELLRFGINARYLSSWESRSANRDSLDRRESELQLVAARDEWKRRHPEVRSVGYSF
jgi:hypothetical protein